MAALPPPQPTGSASPDGHASFALTAGELLQQFEESQRLAGIGSWSWDVRSNAVSWSRETYRVLRLDVSVPPSFEVVLARAIDAEHAQRFMDHLNAALRGETEYNFEISARGSAQDGDEIVIVHTRGTVERDAGGAPVRMTGTVQDVTAMRRAEQALRDSEAQFRVLSDASPIGVFRTDVSGAVLYANARLLDLFGLDFAQFVTSWASRVHPDDVVSLQQAMASMGTVPFSHEYRIVVEGELRWVRVRTEQLVDAQGQTHGHVGSVLDTTAERLAAQEQQRLRAQLEQSRRLESLGLLAGGIAHDFNNLLVGILANATLAREDVAPESPMRDVLDDIARSAQRAGELTRQLLTYAGRARPARRPVAIAPLVRELPLLLGARIPPHVALELQAVETAVAAAVVDGDATQLRQVLLNLLTNAVDAIGDRPGRLRIAITDEAIDAARLAACVLGSERAPGRFVVIAVQDSGAGMPRDVQERMFDPFFSTKAAGRGLGLAATLGILQAHAGAVEVESTPGHGTTVRLLLPCLLESETTPSEPVVPLAPHDCAGTVLLVDDDDGARSAARRILAKAGFRVIEATNGRDALDQLAAMPTPPQVIILDLSMPIMGGAECLAALRQQGYRTPVLIVSGFDADDVASALVDQGQARLLQKPYAAAELLGAVREMA